MESQLQWVNKIRHIEYVACSSDGYTNTHTHKIDNRSHTQYIIDVSIVLNLHNNMLKRNLDKSFAYGMS